VAVPERLPKTSPHPREIKVEIPAWTLPYLSYALPRFVSGNYAGSEALKYRDE
jgi:hypothetical protein